MHETFNQKEERKMNWLRKSAHTLVAACKGDPVFTTITTGLFWLAFNCFEGMIEKLIFGERFEHWLDPVFALVFIAWSAYAVYWCAVYNSASKSA